MPDPKQAGPYRVVDLGAGASAPFYIIQFDAEGRVENPQTRQHLIDHVRTRGVTDLYLFSHGWNNDWKSATKSYDDFIAGYGAFRRRQPALGRPYVPALAGVFWPSVTLVFPWESAPRRAGPRRAAELAAIESEIVRELTAVVPRDRVPRLYELIALRRSLDDAEAHELATLIAPAYAAEGEELPSEPGPPAADELVAMWTAQAARSARSGAVRAGIGGLPTPRDILRAFSVWKMKDRAGVVGARGVAPLAAELLATEGVRVHVVGHSFGCKVCLAALCAMPEPARPAASLLLLQPAVSAKCFAVDARDGKPGGYRAALSLRRVAQPILSTFSKYDFALHAIFHLAVRRKQDLGEIGRAAVSPFAALGGYGAIGCAVGENEVVDVALPPRRYTLKAGGPRLLSVRADATIGGHGEIRNDSTWWALWQQVDA